MEGADERAPGLATRPDSATLAASLDRYLDARGIEARVAGIAPVEGGFETYIYRVRLEPAPARGDAAPWTVLPLALPLAVPLILRLAWQPQGAAALAWEARVLEVVRRGGVPVPRVYLTETGANELGSPFLLMEHARGVRLDEAAVNAHPLASLRVTRAFAHAQAAIFRVPWRQWRDALPNNTGWVLAPAASAAERLAGCEQEIAARGLDALRPVAAWFRDNLRAIERGRTVFLHGDCHPRNMLIDGYRVTAVIDWSAAGFGDQHEDIGWASMLIATTTDADPRLDRRLGLFRGPGRWFYLAFLWERVRLDRAALRWGEVMAALRWLLIFLPSYRSDAGPPVLNADAAAFVTPRYVRRVERFIERRTGLHLRTSAAVARR